MASATLGVVEPAWNWAPPFDPELSLGDEVADLCELAQYRPDENQRIALDAIFAEDEAALPAVFEVAVIGCRQNLKTGVMKQASLGWLFLLGVGRVVYTAHDWNPACADMFREMDQLIEGCSWLSKRVKTVYRGNGEESIECVNGSQMLFKTRTKSGGRAMAGDKLIFDEAFELQDTHTGSLIPILSTRPLAQILYGSSAGKPQSAVLRSVRDRGRAGVLDQAAGDPSLAYLEWCAPDPQDACDLGIECDHGKRTPGCGCDKPELWQRANPAMGRRITVEYIAKERRALSPAEFARERMGWWDDPAPVSIDPPALDAERWEQLEDPDPAHSPAVMTHFGVEVDPDRAWASIGTAGWRDDELCGHPEPTPGCGCDGRTQLEVVERRRGTAWVVPFCRTLNDREDGATFVIDGGGPAASLIPEFEDEGFHVIVAGAADVAEAAGATVDGVNEGTIAHGPDALLNAAAVGAKRRYLGDGKYAFGRRASTDDVTPLVAVSLAAWALEQEGGPNLW